MTKISTISLSLLDTSNFKIVGLPRCQVFQEILPEGKPVMRFWIRSKDLSEDYGPFDHPFQASAWINLTNKQLRRK